MDERTREAHRRIFEKSLATFPAPVAKKARAEFPGSADCYRLKDGPGHYFLIVFAPPGSFPEYITPYDDSLTAVVMHGTDSNLPEEIIIKVPFAQLVLCDCGKWELPEGITFEDYEVDNTKAINVSGLATLRRHSQASPAHPPALSPPSRLGASTLERKQWQLTI